MERAGSKLHGILRPAFIKSMLFCGLISAVGLSPARIWAQDQPPADAPAVAAPAEPQVSAANPGASLPATLTIPAGSTLRVRTTSWLSSDNNHPGDTFSATLDQPVVVNGWVVARRGQTILGRVSVAQKASHGGNSQLGVELSEITLVDGQQVPVSTQLVQGTQQRDDGQAAATVVTRVAMCLGTTRVA